MLPCALWLKLCGARDGMNGRVDAVSVSDVKKVADQVINDQDHALAAVG
jgi:hypothetical protein